NDVNLSTLINRLSKIIPPKYFFSCRKNISEIVYLIPRYDFEPNNISSLLNVFSKWPISIQEAPYSETIKYLLQKISYHAQNFNAQDISVTLNALSKWSG
ncbi:hypothetical protein, partial [Rickettsiella grylli]|uniref:hypothetical protein n=1 Tax=Rickettsiella grylli TaxID=59196 RepID=UPI000A42764B